MFLGFSPGVGNDEEGSMKRVISLLIALMLLAMSYSAAYADKPVAVDSNGVEIAWSKSGCTTIQSGLLHDSLGRVLTTGYDEFWL